MKYTYAYKTSDGTRHEATMVAKNREEVFAELRKQGIKAIKVVAADGSKANGEIKGVRKRVVCIVAIVTTITSVILTTFYYRSTTPTSPQFVAVQARRQIIGDTAIVDKGIATGWSEVFPEEGERFLASFAIPGVKAGQRNSTIEELNASLLRSVEVYPSDTLEIKQIKAMVEGMKEEARAYIAAGGNIVEYGKRLTERQEAEIAVYNRIKAEIGQARKTMQKSDFLSFWEKRNNQLRNLGIRLVPFE